MKKILLSLSAVFVFGLTNAQEINFGVKAGLNLATLTGDIDDAKSKTGFHVGAVAEFKLTDNFSIQPELLYSAQGAKTEYSESAFGMTVTAEEDMKINYLTLPVMAKYYVIEGLSIQAGPQISYLLSAEYDYEVSGGGMSESGTEDIKDDLKSIDFGLAAGVGYELPMGLFFQGRYVVGLSNIVDADEADLKNQVIQFSVGFKF